LPLLYNGALLPVDELARSGFKITIHIGSLMAAYVNFRDALRQLKDQGDIGVKFTPAVFEELTKLMGVPEIESRAEKYTT
jgi:undecaprenyl pyrophosphate phosphatase UppP